MRQRDCDGRAAGSGNDCFTSCILCTLRPEVIGAGFAELEREHTVFRRHGLRIAAVDRRPVINSRLRRDRRKLCDIIAAHFGMRKQIGQRQIRIIGDGERSLRVRAIGGEVVHTAFVIGVEQRVREHRYVHKIAVVKDQLVCGRADAGALQRIGTIQRIDQILIVIPEFRHIHMTGTAPNRQEVGILPERTLANILLVKTDLVMLQCRNKQMQHGRLFNHIAGFVVLIVFLQTIVRKVKICDLDGNV